MPHPATRLPAFDPESGTLNVIVETSKGSRNKIAFDPARELYELSGVLPAGASFPYDFGFIPSTVGEDGDPIDVLVMMDEPVFAGCLVRCRLLGVITARQTERDGEAMRNDRLVAVSAKSSTHDELHSLADLSEALLHQIEHFFISYNDATGKRFEVLGRKGPRAARTLVEEGEARHRSAQKRRAPRKAAKKPR
ncbi:MAG: inorganic diphosphatase [Gemmatimonadetes bacterium]|nr:inorganic diphosphatase [Gemmatimonadota bacterium]